MKKANVFRSSNFWMFDGDTLHILIEDEAGTTATFTLNTEYADGTTNQFDAPDPPTAISASDITSSGFTANLNLSENALGYYLDVAEDSAFTSMVAGYDNLDIGFINEYDVVGLDDAITYYYRFRAYNDYGTSTDSNVITTTTANEVVTDADGNVYTYVTIGTQQWMVENFRSTKYADGTAIPNVVSSVSDWFLPSKDELAAMYNNLQLFSVGGFNDGGGSYSDSIYMSSSEALPTPSGLVWVQSFADGVQYNNSFKNEDKHIRPCRIFVADIGAYSLRDSGPSGGLIFYINGGTTYYEAAPYDLSNNDWSNVVALEVGTNTAIGTGIANTAAIIAQVGHTLSAAKDCNDFVLTSDSFWINDTVGAYCVYNNDPANIADYGLLYNWYAVDNAHGLAPAGWREATQADWVALIAALGGITIAGGKLKEIGLTHWASPNTGATDDYEMSVLPTGSRSALGIFTDITLGGNYWSATALDATNARSYGLSYNSADIGGGTSDKNIGNAVRMMRDL